MTVTRERCFGATDADESRLGLGVLLWSAWPMSKSKFCLACSARLRAIRRSSSSSRSSSESDRSSQREVPKRCSRSSIVRTERATSTARRVQRVDSPSADAGAHVLPALLLGACLGWRFPEPCQLVATLSAGAARGSLLAGGLLPSTAAHPANRGSAAAAASRGCSGASRPGRRAAGRRRPRREHRSYRGHAAGRGWS